jgi:hypothetical protein
MEDEMKLRGLVVLTAAAVMSITATAYAVPSTGRGVAAAVQSKALGVGRTSVTFIAEYDAEAYYGPVQCSGKHQTDPKRYEGSRDVEKCESTSPPLLTVMPGEIGEWFPGSSGWDSDYNGAAASSASYTVNGKATKFKLIAYYPAEA